MGSSLYRLLGARLGQGYEKAKSRPLFRDIVQATPSVTIDKHEILVRLQKRVHNPLLIAAGCGETAVRVPWLGRKRLRRVHGALLCGLDHSEDRRFDRPGKTGAKL